MAAPAASRASGALNAPAFVLENIGSLKQIDSVTALPKALQNGNFKATEIRTYDTWRLAEPHADWQATDLVSKPGLPDRRLVFAACDAVLCILHYELGGRGSSVNLLALARDKTGWIEVWHAVGVKKLKNLTEMKRLLIDGAGPDFKEADKYTSNY